MKKEVTTTAKTIYEALAAAVKELGAPSVEAIEYTVIEEPKRPAPMIANTGDSESNIELKVVRPATF